MASEVTAKLAYGKNPTHLKDVPKGIRFYNAGHVPGSLQIAIDTPEGKIVYTGDFKLLPRFWMKGADVIDCDYLIIESTYARIVHPPYEEVVEKFRNFIKRKKGTKIIGAYPLGKAQEVILLLNEEGISPIVTEDIGRVNKLYISHNTDIFR